MDISTYIQQGQCNNSRLSFIFGGIVFFFIGLIYALCFYFLSTTEMNNFFTSIPTIQIENGITIQPKQTVFEKKIPFLNSYVRIDTTQKEASKVLESGIMLTQNKCYISWNGQVQISELPTKKTTLDADSIKQNLISGLYKTTLIFGFILFIMLWLGFMLTFIFTRLIYTGLNKESTQGSIKRAACVGWISIIILNIILSCIGYALNFLIAVPLAIVIALFCLYNN